MGFDLPTLSTTLLPVNSSEPATNDSTTFSEYVDYGIATEPLPMLVPADLRDGSNHASNRYDSRVYEKWQDFSIESVDEELLDLLVGAERTKI